MNKRIIVILGMGRSGTSFLANWLHKCGVDMGENLKPADDVMNTEGFYEDVEMNIFIQGIRKKSVSLLDTFLVKSVKWTFDNNTIRTLGSILQNKDKKKIWGWKEPATTYLWNELWVPILVEINLFSEVLVIGAIRNFEKCVESNMRAAFLTKRTFLKKTHFKVFKNRFANRYLKEWIICNLQIIDFVENNKHNNNWLLLDTKYLLESSEKVYAHLVNESGLKIHYIDPNSIYDNTIMDRKSNIKYKLDTDLLTQAHEIFEKLISLKENPN